MPTRFRRRFLLRGEILEDSATLESPMDLNLVFVPLADVSQMQADDLVAAAERGSVAEVETMLQSYAGHLKNVHLLLEAGANKEVADDVGHTALNTASCAGNVEIVRLLLEAGAKTDVANLHGRTALNNASRAGYTRSSAYCCRPVPSRM